MATFNRNQGNAFQANVRSSTSSQSDSSLANPSETFDNFQDLYKFDNFTHGANEIETPHTFHPESMALQQHMVETIPDSVDIDYFPQMRVATSLVPVSYDSVTGNETSKATTVNSILPSGGLQQYFAAQQAKGLSLIRSNLEYDAVPDLNDFMLNRTMLPQSKLFDGFGHQAWSSTQNAQNQNAANFSGHWQTTSAQHPFRPDRIGLLQDSNATFAHVADGDDVFINNNNNNNTTTTTAAADRLHTGAFQFGGVQTHSPDANVRSSPAQSSTPVTGPAKQRKLDHGSNLSDSRPIGSSLGTSHFATQQPIAFLAQPTTNALHAINKSALSSTRNSSKRTLTPLSMKKTKSGIIRIEGYAPELIDAPKSTVRLPACEMSAIELLFFFPNHTQWPDVMLRLLGNGWKSNDMAAAQLYARGIVDKDIQFRRNNALRQQTIQAGKIKFNNDKWTPTTDRADLGPTDNYDVSTYTPRHATTTSDLETAKLVDIAAGVVWWPHADDWGSVAQVIKYAHDNELACTHLTTKDIPRFATMLGFQMPASSTYTDWDQQGLLRLRAAVQDAKNRDDDY